MQIIYNDKRINVTECTNFFSRLKGFMFCDIIDKALLFNNCNSIHTFFMKKNIDVIMCDRDNNILYYFNNVSKNRIIWPKNGVYKTIEMPVNFFDIKIGTKIRMVME